MGPTGTIRLRDFTQTPGARLRSDGPKSGQEFREEVLVPAFAEAANRGESLVVDLDGVYGVALSFLDEAFGELGRTHGSWRVRSTLRLISRENPGLVADISALL